MLEVKETRFIRIFLRVWLRSRWRMEVFTSVSVCSREIDRCCRVMAT